MIQYSHKPTNNYPYLLAIISGAGATLAFAPFSWHLAALFSPALFIWLLDQSDAATGVKVSYSYGLAFMGTSVHWVYVSIHTYGDFHPIAAASLTVLFVGLMAVYWALIGVIYTRVNRPSLVKRLVIFPVLWVLSEWLRGYLFTGFPWMLLGYSQSDGVVGQLSTIVGVHGVSFLLVFCAGLLVEFVTSERDDPYSLLAIILIIWAFGAACNHIDWVQYGPESIRASLIQANLTPRRVWKPAQIEESLAIYHSLSAAQPPSDLIIWPESAIPIPSSQAKALVADITRFAQEHKTTIITGIPINASQPGDYYNSALALGLGNGQYHKRQLVPFGEYTPLLQYLSEIYRYLAIPLSNFQAGPMTQNLLRIGPWSIGTYVCYDIAFSHVLRHDLPKANFLITLNNDGWFGHSIASAQHLQIAQLRSIQTRRYQLFTTTNGKTAIISPRGKILQQTHDYQQASLQGVIHPAYGNTPWAYWGDAPLVILCLFALVSQLYCGALAQARKNVL